ncbi:MAG: hypothetical protein WCP46_00990 [Alphaproteobacteria bacterium]
MEKSNLHDIYTTKARKMRINFESAKKLQCPLTHPLFKTVIRDIINIDTPPELLAPLNKLAHTLVAEYDEDLKATIITKLK